MSIIIDHQFLTIPVQEAKNTLVRVVNFPRSAIHNNNTHVFSSNPFAHGLMFFPKVFKFNRKWDPHLTDHNKTSILGTYPN